MDELKPCPFCGGNDIQIDEMESFWDKNETSWRVLCINCIAETAGDTKEQAIAAWNRRADHIRDTTKKVSNADRIRSMSDEELARWLVDATVCERVCAGDEYCHGNECVKRVTDWLRQPAKEEHREAD